MPPHGQRGRAEMAKIVVVNDDSPRSPGLLALLEELRRAFPGEVLAFVPDRPRSGAGKSITLGSRIELREQDEGFYLVSGTPADAVLVALASLGPEKPGVVVSGINMGPNLGLEDFLQSGTIGAAVQAALHRVPALAISYVIGEGFPLPPEEQVAEDLKLAAKLAVRLVEAVLAGGLPEDVDLLSVNVPAGAGLDRIAITELFREPFWKAVGRDGAFSLAPWPGMKPQGPEGTDVWAVLNGYISITPLSLDMRYEKEALRAFLEEHGLPPTLI